MPDVLLQVTIKDRNGQIFQGSVISVSSSNHVGPFDVLVNHSNMVTTIREHVTLQKSPDVFEKIEINSGLLRATNNSVELYIGL